MHHEGLRGITFYLKNLNWIHFIIANDPFAWFDLCETFFSRLEEMAKIQADYAALQNDFKKRCEEVSSSVRLYISIYCVNIAINFILVYCSNGC